MTNRTVHREKETSVGGEKNKQIKGQKQVDTEANGVRGGDIVILFFCF